MSTYTLEKHLEVKIRKNVSRIFTLEADFRTSGECLGILGASGCGKSMTLKCIAGIETPDEGRIVLNGRVLFDSQSKINIRPQERRVGYLFQNYALFPKMSVESNIGIGLSSSKGAKKEKVDELMSLFRLEGLGGRYPDQLSGGQQQRVALARMLACEPELILLDEPFSALDTYLREQMQINLMEIIKVRKNVIMVSHSRDEVFRVCSDMLLMDGGRVLETGATKEIFSKPRLVFTAQMTGCKNISPIKITGEREVFATDWGVSLRTAEPVTASINHVGIRAHDLKPVFDPQPGMDNLIQINVLNKIEDPFEYNLIFRNSRPDKPEEGAGDVWWKFSKYILDEIPPYLRFPPECLLLLKG